MKFFRRLISRRSLMPFRAMITLLAIFTFFVSSLTEADAQGLKFAMNKGENEVTRAREFRFASLFAPARLNSPTGFALMSTTNFRLNSGASVFSLTPVAAASVSGGGSTGRLAKWTSLSTLGDSVLYEDKDGRIGIGTSLPTSRLTVLGMIESLSGGIKFPDGSVQTTAASSTVVHDASLTGSGTPNSPLGIAPNGVNTTHLSNGAVTAGKIANGTVVRSLNGLTEQVNLVAGSNITITPNGNTLTIASNVVNPAQSVIHARLELLMNDGQPNTIGTILTVPANKRLVIEYVTVRAGTLVGFIDKGSLITVVNGVSVNHSIVPVRLFDDPNPTYATDKQVRVYADGGTNVQFFIGRTTNQSIATADITISGYLVDVP
jgi:hypothetical protein